LAATLLAPRAYADPPPRVSRILWSDDGQTVLLVTNRGLIFGDAEPVQFRLMCNQAIGVGVGDPPTLAYLSDGRWMAATTTGLKTTADSGCNWQGVEPLAALQTPALAQHPTARDTVYVAAYGSGQGGIYVTPDKGVTLSVVLPLQDNEFTHSIVMAASNPSRIYAAGIAFDDAGNFTHYVLRSPDGGTSWERFPVALGELDERATLVAVHPANEDEVLLKTTSLSPEQHPERLLLSRDGGESFTSAFEGLGLSDISYAKQGAEVWVANVDGLWRSNDALTSFNRQGLAEWMSCVTEREGRLWGCGLFAGATGGKDGIGISSDGGQLFEPWMDFREVDEPVACDARAETAVACEAAWAHWQFEVLGSQEPGDASTSTGGNAGSSWRDAAGGTAGQIHRDGPRQSDSGCTVARPRGKRSAHPTFLYVAAIGLSLLRRRLRKRREQCSGAIALRRSLQDTSSIRSWLHLTQTYEGDLR
jgi:hypothetical protein